MNEYIFARENGAGGKRLPDTASWLGLQQGVHPGLHSSLCDKAVHVCGSVKKINNKNPVQIT